MIFTGVNQMEYGKDFHSTFVQRGQRVVSLKKDQMYSRQGFFVTELLLLLCAGFVMPLERIERDQSLTQLFGKKLNRALSPRMDRNTSKSLSKMKNGIFTNVLG